ncbi:hypothetical protein TNCV_4281181 [Trichonephila clavipes]|nr:hypothetical protein TNCV_4281181 [Trichonephila clavipes]
MGAVIPDVLHPSAFRWFEKTQGPIVKVLHMSGQRPMRQLALPMRVIRCDGLFDDWSVEVVLSLVPVQMTSLLSTGLSSDSSQNGLLDDLLAELTTKLPPSL